MSMNAIFIIMSEYYIIFCEIDIFPLLLYNEMIIKKKYFVFFLIFYSMKKDGILLKPS